MGSSRLPGKVMRPLVGIPMVGHVVARARRIRGVDRVVVATTDQHADDPLAGYLELERIDLFRGSEEDVLDRYMAAARAFGAEVVVRITADCPLLSPLVSGLVVERLRAGGCDYASNTIERTYPRGLDTSACTLDTLDRADREAVDPAEREHVMTYVRRHPERFRLCSVADAVDRSPWRWTVDSELDLQFVSRVFEALLPRNPTFEYHDVLELIERHPEWAEINRSVPQRPDGA